MVRPSPDELPFALVDGWPVQLPGCVVTLRESGLLLGSLLLDDPEWEALRTHPVLSLRVDDHPPTDGWVIHKPSGATTHREFTIPLAPEPVPTTLLTSERAFSEWVSDTHGASGRLVVWDEPLTWWIAHEPDLELFITCAPAGMLSEESDELSWYSFGTGEGRSEVDSLMLRYGLSLPANELREAVLRFIQARNDPNPAPRTEALGRAERLLEDFVRERIDDRSLAASLDGLTARRTAVEESGTLEITGAFYTLATRSGHSTNLMLPMHARLSLEAGAVSTVTIAGAESQSELPKSEREFQRAFDNAIWRYNLKLRLI